MNMAKSKKAAGAAKPGGRKVGPRRESPTTKGTQPAKAPASARVTKADTVIALLREGATCEEIMKETGWQAHSVRGFISGTLRKKQAVVVTKGAHGKYVE